MRWTAGPAMRRHADGRYTVGLRPHNIGSSAEAGDATAIDGKVLITEISGSESVIHFSHGGRTWVSQTHGVRAIEVGASARFYLNLDECMYFGVDGERIAP